MLHSCADLEVCYRGHHCRRGGFLERTGSLLRCSESHGCIELFVLFGVLLAGCHRAADAEDASATRPRCLRRWQRRPRCWRRWQHRRRPRGGAVSLIFRAWGERRRSLCSAGLPFGLVLTDAGVRGSRLMSHAPQLCFFSVRTSESQLARLPSPAGRNNPCGFRPELPKRLFASPFGGTFASLHTGNGSRRDNRWPSEAS